MKIYQKRGILFSQIRKPDGCYATEEKYIEIFMGILLQILTQSNLILLSFLYLKTIQTHLIQQQK